MTDSSTKMLEEFADREYEHGFVTDVEQDTFPPGLDEDVVRAISATLTPRSSASFSAVWTSNAGSLGRTFRFGSGLRYGQSVSSNMRSAGAYRAAACMASAFLNVTMPENDNRKPRSSTCFASAGPPLKL